jgi:hypothetical protein
MDQATMGTVNVVLDFVLVAASIWMIVAARGVGGLVGRTLTFMVIGAIILGVAHLLATVGTSVFQLNGTLNNLIHRVIVLAGFVFLIIGFNQVGELKR